MLHELKNASQEKTGYRRIFIGDYFDLFVWFESRAGGLKGFELSYNKDVDEHSIIWKKNSGWMHFKVDAGESAPGRAKQTPVLSADGLFDADSIAERFRNASRMIDPEISKLVYERLTSHR